MSNLRYIRKKLGLSQEKVAGDVVSRFQISMIETGRSNLIYDTAVMLAKNINKEVAGRKLFDYVSVNELIIPGLVQQKYDFIEASDCNSHQEMEKLEKLSFELQNEYFSVYSFKLLAKYYFEQNKLNVAMVYLNKALTSLQLIENPDHDFEDELYLLAVKVLYNVGDLDYAIEIIEYSITERSVTKEFTYKMMFNKALCYKKKEDFNKSIEILERISEFDNIDPMKLRDYCILLANNYRELKDFNKAIYYYYQAQNFSKRDDLFILSSMMSTYAFLGDAEKAQTIQQKILGLIESVEDKATLARVYENLSYSYIVSENVKKYLEYKKMALQCLIDNNEWYSITEVLKDLSENKQHLSVHKENVIELVEMVAQKDEKVSNILDLIKVFI